MHQSLHKRLNSVRLRCIAVLGLTFPCKILDLQSTNRVLTEDCEYFPVGMFLIIKNTDQRRKWLRWKRLAPMPGCRSFAFFPFKGG